jgi:hypothetical protein
MRADAALESARVGYQQARQALEHRKLDLDAAERRTAAAQRAGSLTIDFPGGTVGDFVAALSQATGAPVNVVIGDAQIASTAMGPVKLRGVTVETAVRVIPSAASPARGQALWDVSRIDDQHGAPVFRIRQVETDRPGGYPIVTEVLSLASASSAGVDAKAVLSAVDAALGMLENAGAPPEIKYHPESALLIVRGTPPQVSTIREVVERVGDDAERRRKEELKRAGARIALEGQTRKLQIQRERAAAELAAAEADFGELKQMRAAGTIPPSQLRDAELKVAQARAGAQMAEAEMVQLQRQAELGTVPGSDDQRAPDRRGAGGAGRPGDQDDVIPQLRAMVEDLKAQNEALQQQLRALQADRLKKGGPEGR